MYKRQDQDDWIKVTPEFVQRVRKDNTAKTAEQFEECLTAGSYRGPGPSTGTNRIAIGKENRLPQSSTLLKYGAEEPKYMGRKGQSDHSALTQSLG